MALVAQPTNIQRAPGGTGIEPRRAYLLACWVVVTSAFFWGPLRAVVAYASENDDASHIFIIPILALGVLYLDRADVFRNVSFDGLAGGVLATLGAAIAIFTWRAGAGTNEPLTLYMIALVILWLAGFALFFGRAALHQGRFGLLFLFLSCRCPNFF